MLKRSVITIGREYASGGRIIARRLAEELGIPFYDKKIISLTAKESGLDETFIRENEQAHTPSLLYNLYFSPHNLPVSDQLFLAEGRVIQQVAAEGPCVIVGRCADYILRERTDLLRVFLYAPTPERIQRSRDAYGVQEKNMETYVARQDKRRASYYDYFTGQTWGNARNFDISLNTQLGAEEVIALLKQAATGSEVRS